jgi:hypothetical protein
LLRTFFITFIPLLWTSFDTLDWTNANSCNGAFAGHSVHCVLLGDGFIQFSDCRGHGGAARCIIFDHLASHLVVVVIISVVMLGLKLNDYVGVFMMLLVPVSDVLLAVQYRRRRMDRQA